MTKTQKIIIIIYLILVAAACIYVPWTVRLPYPNTNLVISIGYLPLWSPPKYSYSTNSPETSIFSMINYGKLFLSSLLLQQFLLFYSY